MHLSKETDPIAKARILIRLIPFPYKFINTARLFGHTPDTTPELFEGNFGHLGDYWILFHEFERIIKADDKDQFISLVKIHHNKIEKLPPMGLFHMSCKYDAVRCASALLDQSQLQLRHLVDLNKHFGGFPIVVAALYLSAGMIDFLLERGAHPHIEESLEKALNSIRKLKIFHSWAENDPFNKLLSLFFLPETKKPLHIIKVLASVTPPDQLVKIILNRTFDREFISVAALLVAAVDKLMDPCEDLKSTLFGKCILEQLAHVYEVDDFEFKKIALLDAFSLAKTIWMNSDVIFSMNFENISDVMQPRPIPYTVSSDHAQLFKLPINVPNDNIDCLLPKFNMETKGLPKVSASVSRTFTGDLKPSNLMHFSSRPHYALPISNLSNLKSVEGESLKGPKPIPLKPSSNVGIALNRVLTSVVEVAKTYVKRYMK